MHILYMDKLPVEAEAYRWGNCSNMCVCVCVCVCEYLI